MPFRQRKRALESRTSGVEFPSNSAGLLSAASSTEDPLRLRFLCLVLCGWCLTLTALEAPQPNPPVQGDGLAKQADQKDNTPVVTPTPEVSVPAEPANPPQGGDFSVTFLFAPASIRLLN